METTGEVVKTTGESHGGLTAVRSNAAPPPTSVAPPPPPPQNCSAPPPTTEGFSGGLMMKKKRGRPRKHGHDGAAVVTLSPMPISSAPPTTSHVIDFSAAEKRAKVRPATAIASSFIRTKYQVDNLGEWAPSSAVANFTPHIITVHAGEDVTKRIISFSQQGSLAICVLCANGVVSSVTLRQPDSSGGTLTYEGRFEILSLSGSFMPSDSDGTRSRTGGMTVSLASPDGRVVGGGVAGLLVAATPIQVVVGSSIAGTNQQDQNPKQQHNHNFMSSPTPTTSSSFQMSTWTQHKPSHDFNITLT